MFHFMQPRQRQLLNKFMESNIATLSCRKFASSKKFLTTVKTNTIDANKKNCDEILKPESSKCEPTELLMQYMQKDKRIQEKVIRIQKEYEIYEYFSDFVPTQFKDKNWIYLLRTTSILERVNYWWFMGLTHSRELNDIEAKRIKREKLKNFLQEGENIIAGGGMAYGPGTLYSLMHNPNKNNMAKYFSTKYITQLGMQELPQLLFDFQFIPQQRPAEYSHVIRSGTYAIYGNYMLPTPFPVSFINVNMADVLTSNFFQKHMKKDDDDFKADIYSNNPFHNPHETDPKKQVIYISRNAREQIDGPLIHRAYVVPLTYDSSRETISAINRGHYRAMALPIQRYIKWECGSRKISFPIIVNILHEVANNGGDWARALNLYIPLINRISLEERKLKMGMERYNTMRKHRNLKYEIVNNVRSALGQQPQNFDSRKTLNEWPILEDYASSLINF